MLTFRTATVVPQNVIALATFRGQLWAACYGKGLFFWDGRQWHLYPRCSRYITGLFADADCLWFCTWMEGNIGFVNGAHRPPTLIPLPRLVTPRFVYRNQCIAANPSKVWVGSETHLLRLQKGSREEMPEWDLVLASDIVISIVPLKHSAWIATTGGLWVYTEVDHEFSFRAVRSDLSITSMALDSSSREIWLGSADGTLWRYEMGNRRWESVVKFPIRDSKANITAIHLVNRFVYVAVGCAAVGSLGFKAMPASSAKGGVIVYDRRSRQWQWLEGIQIRDVRSIITFENCLWVGGAEGVQAKAMSTE
jgi:hypothetical protein